MMAAYQPQPGLHPGMAAHGHPGMTPGQPMNPAQLQMGGHPGVSGPGAQHVTQAGALMGMQPGANGMGGPAGMAGQHPGGQMAGMPGQMGAQSMAGGMPGAHAMSQMTPQQMMQQQQMQAQFQNNPQLMQRQYMLQRQQQLQQMQAQGLAGMQQGGMPGISLQQMQQMQQQNPGVPPQVQLTNHMQMQLRAQQMQQLQNQQMQQQQQQQQLAMQHANSQQSNQSAQQGPPSQQGGPPQHPGQMRPQSRMANPTEQSQGGQPPPQGQPGQQPQPQQQQPQQPSQPQSQPQQQVQPGQPPGQVPNPQQQQGQQQAPQPQQMNPQQVAMARAQQQQQQQQQQQRFQLHLQQQSALAARQQMAAQAQQQQSGQFILRLMLFGDQLSNFNPTNGKEITSWHNFVERHFGLEARLLHIFHWNDGTRPKVFEVPRATIARYFQSYFESGAQGLRLHIEHSREVSMAQNRHQVSFSNATFTVSYPNGARCEMHGAVSVLFAPGSDLVECMQLETTNVEEVIARSKIEEVLTSYSPQMANKTSPKLAKNKSLKAQKMQSQFDGLTIDHFPRTPKGSFGIASRTQQFLELGETMNLLPDLIGYAQEKRVRPEQALEALAAQYEQQGALPNGMPPGAAINNPAAAFGLAQQQAAQQQQHAANGLLPAGARTPNMGMHPMSLNPSQPGFTSSPHVSHLNLPMQPQPQPNGAAGMPAGMVNGSPHFGLAPNMNMQPNSHTPSPHQSNMAAPPMLPQHSQQGTNSSSAASANTSPQVNNKRRRSQVKAEGEEGPGGGDAGRVRPSPRIGKKGKP